MKTPRILVIRGGAIGDFITTLPALAALREQWPEGHLEILGYPHIMALANGRGYADAVRSIEARALTAFYVPNGDLDPSWMAYFRGFNVIISYLYDPDEIFAENLKTCGVKHLVKGAPKPVALPASQHYCKPLETLAIYVENPTPRVHPNEEDRQFAREYLRTMGVGKIAAIHPGSGGMTKNWAPEKFAEMARWLVAEKRHQLLMVSGEADTATMERIFPLLPKDQYKVVSGLKLTELAPVLELCSVHLGNDSGITHLAAAVGTPTVALFGPASKSIWEPRGKNVRVVGFGEGDVERAKEAVDESLLL